MGIKRVIKANIKANLKKITWKMSNRHNRTYYENVSDFSCVHVGNATYGPINVLISRKDTHLYIGNYCSIAPGVKFVLSSEHNTHRVSTYPFKVAFLDGGLEAESKGNIVVGDDVWLGCNAIVLSGVHIGQGAVVAAGAVVSKDVPPYSIVAGVPAKVIKYRFSQAMIEELIKIDYSKLTEIEIKEHIDELYQDLIETKQFDWMPKKE